MDYETEQMCFPDTAVLITRFITEGGVGEVVDFMPSGRKASKNHRLARMLRCVRGQMRFKSTSHHDLTTAARPIEPMRP